MPVSAFSAVPNRPLPITNRLVFSVFRGLGHWLAEPPLTCSIGGDIDFTPYGSITILTIGDVIHGDYEWDDAKATANVRKHGVSFDEAAEALEDVHEVAFEDPTDPAIVRSLAMSPRARVLLVVTSARHQRTRIISARKADSHEQRAYDQARS